MYVREPTENSTTRIIDRSIKYLFQITEDANLIFNPVTLLDVIFPQNDSKSKPIHVHAGMQLTKDRSLHMIGVLRLVVLSVPSQRQPILLFSDFDILNHWKGTS